MPAVPSVLVISGMLPLPVRSSVICVGMTSAFTVSSDSGSRGRQPASPPLSCWNACSRSIHAFISALVVCAACSEMIFCSIAFRFSPYEGSGVTETSERCLFSIKSV